MYATHGSPSSALAAMAREDRRERVPGVREPPGMIDGPRSAPSSPPETPVPTKCRPRGRELVGAPVGVGEVRVAAVDEDVAGLEVRLQVRDDAVDRLAGRHHDQDAPRPLERLP